MKFLCGNCKAKYQIADEKVSGRTLRMKCRRCGHDILIDGHSMAQPGSPQAVSSPRRSGGSTVSVMPAPGRMGSGAHAMPSRGAAPGLPRPGGGRSKPPSGLNAEFRRHVAAPPEVPQRTASYDLWHVAIQDVPVGPMTRDELGRKVEAGAVTTDSLCWREGMDDWRPLGELPELAQLLRRARELPREVSRGGRARPPAAGTRAAQFPTVPDESDDDAAEPTRIEMSPLATQSSVAAPAPTPPASVGSAASAAGAAATPAGDGAAAPSKGTMGLGLTTGIALGLLAGILLVGGPMLYKNTWGTPHVQPSQPAAAAPAQRERPAKSEESADLDLEAPEQPENKAAPQPGRAPNKGARAKAETAEKKSLSEEQRRLLERMGGGGNDPDLSGVSREREGGGGAGQPTLTPQQLTKVVQDNKNALQRCYETALRAAGGKQDGAIKVTVNVVVGLSGATKSVSTQGEGLGNMTDCLRAAVKRWRFPQSGGESEFAFPLVFQPGA